MYYFTILPQDIDSFPSVDSEVYQLQISGVFSMWPWITGQMVFRHVYVLAFAIWLFEPHKKWTTDVISEHWLIFIMTYSIIIWFSITVYSFDKLVHKVYGLNK